MGKSVRMATLVLSLGILAGCASNAGLTGKDGGGWTRLVDDGRGLDNFTTVGEADWSNTNGALQATRGGKDPAYLLSRQSYRDLQLRVEFWASNDANSGIFLRCQSLTKLSEETCYEANIFDTRPDPSYGTGSIVRVARSPTPMPKAGGRWNTYEITMRGTHLTVVLNGQTTVDVDDARFASGPIALQWGAGTVRFRRVEIRSL